MKIYPLFLIFLICEIYINPIEAQHSYVDFSGRISNLENNGLGNVLIGVKAKKRYTQSDKRGMFSLATERGDTVLFHQLGFSTRKIVIPDTLKEQFYSLELTMVPDTIIIDPVVIFPWQTYDEFKAAFLALRLDEEKEMHYAKQNIALINSQLYSYEIRDSRRNFYIQQQQFNNSYSRTRMVPTSGLFSPFAWAKFIKALSDGSLTNSRDLPELPKEKKNY